MSLQRQTPINGTYQKRVPPGSHTNLYYILLSNLPWQTSWQQLKDHVRSVCPVERVEVFNESTTGWVSVRGRNNFEAAFDLLNGGIFNGRPLFADGKNATNPVMIKEPVEATQAHQHTPTVGKLTRRLSPALTGGSGVAPITISSLPPAQDQWLYSSPSCAVLPVSATDCSTMRNAGYSYESPPGPLLTCGNGTSKCPGIPPTWSTGSMDYPPMYYYSHVAQAQMPTHTKSSRPLGYGGGLRASHPRGMPSFPTEHTVIVRHIAPHVTYSEFDHLLRNKIGRDVDSVLFLELPISDSYDSNSGFAVATFDSQDAASRAVRKFNGTKFENRILKAELTSESGVQGDLHRPTRSRRTKHGEREKSNRASSHSEHSKKSRPIQKAGVIIANGSSSLCQTNQKS